MATKLFPLLVLTSTFFSCSFNKLFLQPDKYPKDLSVLTVKTKADTLKVYFSETLHQPTFAKHNGRDTISPQDFTIESVVFTDSKGHLINGWFLKPKQQKATITLLHIHGNAGSLFSQYRAISPLIKNGFQVFLFDYSGFGFSQGKATSKNALVNALSAFDYLKARPDVAGTKLVIYGQSFGGHLAPVVAEQKQKEMDALVTEGAFSSFKDVAASRVPVIGRIFVKQTYSARRSIKNYTRPLLIIHSNEDKVIPFKQGKIIYSNANSPKEFYEIQKCHICGPTYYPDEISQKIKNMLK